MRTGSIVILSLLLASAAASGAGAFTGTAAVSGDVVLTFSGTNVSARFVGEMVLSGTLPVGSGSVQFSAEGSVRGTGRGDTASLSGDAWGTFVVVGKTDQGKAITLSGGLAFSSSGLTLSDGNSGTATGTFCLIAELEGSRIEVQGQARASGSGEFVKPSDPYTMQMAGTGLVELEAGFVQPPQLSTSLPAAWQGLPWDPRTWPQDLQAELLRLLGRPENP